jgi:hypothetical protein
MYIYHEIRCNYISTYDILERMQKEYYESPSLTFWKTNRYTSVTSPFNNGWLMVYLPLWKYDFGSWDDDIPNIWKLKFIFQTTNQTYFVNMVLPSLPWGKDLCASCRTLWIDFSRSLPLVFASFSKLRPRSSTWSEQKIGKYGKVKSRKLLEENWGTIMY